MWQQGSKIDRLIVFSSKSCNPFGASSVRSNVYCCRTAVDEGFWSHILGLEIWKRQENLKKVSKLCRSKPMSPSHAADVFHATCQYTSPNTLMSILVWGCNHHFHHDLEQTTECIPKFVEDCRFICTYVIALMKGFIFLKFLLQFVPTHWFSFSLQQPRPLLPEHWWQRSSCGFG